MPNKYNDPHRHKIPKANYKLGRWAENDADLRRRGSLTLWITEEALAGWAAAARLHAGWATLLFKFGH